MHIKIIKHVSVIKMTNALLISNCLLLKQKYFMHVNEGNLEQAESTSCMCSNTLQKCFNIHIYSAVILWTAPVQNWIKHHIPNYKAEKITWSKPHKSW